jgi:NAD(P)-dependent dehydrogenase (short-subunit alcohol dehydrogenase family)
MGRLSGSHVVVVGGSSGMGAAIATLARTEGGRITIGSRNPGRFSAPEGMTVLPLDLGLPQSIADFAERLDPIDHLVITAHAAATLQTLKPVQAIDLADLESVFRIKLFGTLRLIGACLPAMTRHGSIILFSGAASRRTIPNHVGLGALNAAVEGAGRQLARELAPIRVNVLSPGLVRTPAYDAMPAADREAMFAARAAALPVGRVGMVDDIALAAIHLMCNGYVTGTVQDIDGGALLG